MHIAYLTPEYPHPALSTSGGLGTSIKNLAVGLVKKGHEATVVVTGQDKDSNFSDEGISIVGLKRKEHHLFNWYLERKRIEVILQSLIDTKGIQLLEAPDWTGQSAFMKFSVPLIIRLNGSDAYFCHLEGRKQKWKNYFLEKLALKNANTIISVSDFTGAVTKKIFKLEGEIKTIHNSLDTDKFSPISTSIVDSQMLYFGTIIRKKGVLELAKAFNIVVEKNPEAKLVLLGKDAEDIVTQKSTLALFYDILSAPAKENVTYIEEVIYSEVKQFLAKTQIVVLPSFAEAFPMAWLEALSMEKALLSSNIGWSKELMIHGVTGLTVNPKNSQEFADYMLNMLENRDKCIAYGKAGRKHVENNFSISIITEQNVKYYNHLIAQ